jgi:hypothetical protein
MTKWGKILGAIGVLLIAAGVSVTALITQYDYNNLKPTIIKLVKDATGRDLLINGDLQLAVSMSPAITASDISFSNAPWGEAGDMVHLDQLAAKVDLIGLLKGRISVDYLVFEGLKVVLQTDGNGRANWEFEAPGGASKMDTASTASSDLTLVPSARDIRLKDVDVTYIDGASKKRLHFLLARANFAADNYNAPMHGSLVAAYRGVNVNASVDMGSLALLVGKTGKAFPVDLRVSAPGLDASLKGTVDQPEAGMSVNADFHMTLNDSATLAQLTGTEVLHIDGLNVMSKISGEGAQYAFKGFEARVGESDFGGDVNVNLAGQRPRFSGQLISKMLDVDQILGLEEPKSVSSGGLLSSGDLKIATVKPEGDAPAIFSKDPLALDALKLVDADISVLADSIKVSNLSLSALKAGVKLDDGKLNVKPLSLGLADGSIVFSTFVVNAATKRTAVKVSSTVNDLDLGRVLQLLGHRDLLTLPVNGKIDMNSEGDSVHALMAGLNGKVVFSGEGGTINDTTITNLISGLGDKLPWVKSAQVGRISCLIADWPVKSGNAVAEVVLLDTPGFAVAVTGNVDLGGERLHLTVTPEAKTASLASFAVPVRVKGALSMPYLDVSPSEAVVGTVGNIVKAPATLLVDLLGLTNKKDADGTGKNPCIAAFGKEQSKDKPVTSSPPSSTPASNPAVQSEKKEAPKAQLKDLGKALEGLLGK